MPKHMSYHDTIFQVLKAFKALHRARTTVFEGDDYALDGKLINFKLYKCWLYVWDHH